MNYDRIRQFLNLFFALAQPIVATLVNLEITGPGIGTISNRYPTYVVPAGYAFSIWSVIFALSLGYGIWQVLPQQRQNPLLRRIGWLTASSLAATSVWMLVFQRSLFVLSLLVMIWLLLSLIGVVAKLYAYQTTMTKSEQWLVYLHISIFLGWITVATVANAGQVLTVLGWVDWGLPASLWGMGAIFVAGLIAAVVTIRLQGNMPYALTVIWALIAVAVNQFSAEIITSSKLVGMVAIAAIILIGIALVISRRQVDSTQNIRWETTPQN